MLSLEGVAPSTEELSEFRHRRGELGWPAVTDSGGVGDPRPKRIWASARVCVL